jgi:spore coat protein U-like protein
MRISRSMFTKLLIVPSFMSVLASGTAAADVQSDNLNVSATVVATCTIVAAPVNFGTYDITAPGDHTATGSVTVNCSQGAPVFVTLGQGVTPGTGSTDAVPARQMDAGTGTMLGYNLFQDAGFTRAWGNTAATSVGTSGTGANQALVVYGVIPAGQAVPSGTYQDSVIATVNY